MLIFLWSKLYENEKISGGSCYLPVIVYFAQGILAKSKSDYQQAEHYFKTMLEHDIDFTRGRLELARILFENHKNEEAKQHFQAIYPQLPKQIQAVIDIYLQAIEQRFQ